MRSKAANPSPAHPPPTPLLSSSRRGAQADEAAAAIGALGESMLDGRPLLCREDAQDKELGM